MDLKKENILSNLLLVLLFVATLTLAYGFLRPGHGPNGDFSLYVRQIQAIWQGDASLVYQDMKFMLDNSTSDTFSPTLYPWGLPLLMAPFYPLFGLNYFAYKVVLMLLFAGSIGLTFMLFRRKENFLWQAFLIAALLAIQPKYLTWLNMVLSEIPYLFFVMLSMYAIHKIYIHKNISIQCIPSYIGLGILMMFTAQIRTEGFLLFPSLAVWHLYYLCRNHTQWTSWQKAPRFFLTMATPYLAALAFYLLLSFILPSGFLKHTEHFAYTSNLRVMANVFGYFQSLQQFLLLGSPLITLSFLIIALWGIIYRFPKDLPEMAFLLFCLALFFIWPHRNTRHLFTLLPFLLYFFTQGLASIPLNIFKINYSTFILAAAFLFAAPQIINLSYQAYQTRNFTRPSGTDSENIQEMFDYVRNHIPQTDVVVNSQPRTLYLYTGRRSISLWGTSDMLQRPADWYVWGIHNGSALQYSKEEIEEYSNELTEMFRNDEYVIYKIKKDVQ